VAARITRELKLPCALPMLFRYPTVAALAAALAPVEGERDHSLVALQTQGGGLPVFCISGVEIYQALADRLAGFPVYGLFSPMEAAYWSSPNHAALPSVRELAADYLRVVRARQPSGPYLLAGFSFGGVLAYEMAQQLTELGESVPLLVILDSDPPRSTMPTSLSGFTFSARPILTGTRALLDLGRRFGGRGRDDHSAGAAANEGGTRLQRYLAAMRHYRARPYRGRALLVESSEARAYDPGHGWDALIADLKVQRVSSSHVQIFEPRHLDEWSRELRALLDAVG
jgi:thioesterase domain-containing protein